MLTSMQAPIITAPKQKMANAYAQAGWRQSTFKARKKSYAMTLMPYSWNPSVGYNVDRTRHIYNRLDLFTQDPTCLYRFISRNTGSLYNVVTQSWYVPYNRRWCLLIAGCLGIAGCLEMSNNSVSFCLCSALTQFNRYISVSKSI